MPQQSSDGYYEALWPRAERRQPGKALAPRLASLEGKTVAQLWDFIFRGDEVFAALEGALAERYPGIRFVGWRELGNIHGADERKMVAALPERLKALGVDAAIVGMAC
ncbi:MAG TPA: hypothetical protein VEA40_25810 [Ramlibacter sp.]|nr:hypothetical protein [Ramlibacter sp.]